MIHNDYKTYVYYFLLLFLFIAFYWLVEKEFFQNIELVDFYVITMGNPDRLENIENQIEKMNDHTDSYKINIHKIDAVVGKDLDLDQLIQDGILTPTIYDQANAFNPNINNRKNEVGCCMSHLKTYRTIADSKTGSKYSVVFEDDFAVQDQFLYTLDQVLTDVIEQKIEFDIVMLAIIGAHGEKVYSNINEINCKDSACYYAHAYLIRNESIDKIVDAMKYIDKIADVQIFDKHHEGKIRVLRLESDIVYQNSGYTTIRNH
jgi:GR25 family glycosyltransferase involved in LPS biosynthesis